MVDEESLISIPIKDDELGELLRRLACHDIPPADCPSTIRDVSELTEVPNHVIARILADIRCPAEFSEAVGDHEDRLKVIEDRMKTHRSIYRKQMRNGAFVVVASDQAHAPLYRDFLDLNDAPDRDREDGRAAIRIMVGICLSMGMAAFVVAMAAR